MAEDGLRILVVDDEEALREALGARLEAWGHAVRTAGDLPGAVKLFSDWPPDVVIADIVLPESSGLDLLRRVKEDDPTRPVVMMTAHATVDRALEAMKAGAEDFLTKPLDAEKLQALLDSVRSDLRMRGRIRDLEERLENEPGVGLLVGRSPAMQEIYETVRLLGANEASALITGESGTGKELAARTIHGLSARSGGPFVPLNCAAIPEGLIESELFGHEKGAFTGATEARPGCFELADGGTLFLDEIAEMPMELQPRLLRILEDGRARRVGGKREVSFDVRVLAATNRRPAEALEESRVREDLFYRLHVFHVELPPLREREGDVPLLVQHFIRAFNRKHGTEVEGAGEVALRRLTSCGWPGNVRELRNVIERSVIVAGRGLLEMSHLPPYLRGPEPTILDAGAWDGETAGVGGSGREAGDGGPTDGERRNAGDPAVVLPVGTPAREAEKRLILRTLDHVEWNKAEAARQLGLDVKTIRNKLKKWEEEDEA